MERGPQVLVLEDEPLIADVLEACLSDAGFAVRLCLTGENAVAELEGASSNIQVLLTDIRLPGIDGWAVAQRARELNSNIAVVYVSGDSGHEWPANGVPNSILIEKPYVCVQIITAVSTLLNKTDAG